MRIPGLLLLLVTVLVGCGKGPQPDSARTAANAFFDRRANPKAVEGHFVDPGKLTPSELTFGIAPKRDPRVSFQPDVIVMEQGDRALREARTDGMTYVFDAAAPQVADIAAGKIVFATGRVVGRVGQVSKEGDRVTVKLAPVQITEVIKEGHFLIDSDLDPAMLTVYSAPDFPSTIDTSAAQQQPTSSYGASDTDGLLHTGFIRTQVGLPSGLGESHATTIQPIPGLGSAAALTLGSGLKVVPLISAEPSIGLSFAYHQGGGLVDASGELLFRNPHVRFLLDITPAGIDTFGMEIGGAAGLRVRLDATSDKDRFINAHSMTAVPVDISLNCPVAGIPLALSFKTSFRVDTAFSAKTSTLTAKGEYMLNGYMFVGKKGGASVFEHPKPEARTTLASNVSGTSVGINSLVTAYSVRPMIGIGAFGFMTGVYVGFDFSGAVVKQSSIALQASCRAGYMNGQVDSGVGYQLPASLVKVVNTVLALFTKYRMEEQGTLVRGPRGPFMQLNQNIPQGCAGAADGAAAQGGSS